MCLRHPDNKLSGPPRMRCLLMAGCSADSPLLRMMGERQESVWGREVRGPSQPNRNHPSHLSPNKVCRFGPDRVVRDAGGPWPPNIESTRNGGKGQQCAPDGRSQSLCLEAIKATRGPRIPLHGGSMVLLLGGGVKGGNPFSSCARRKRCPPLKKTFPEPLGRFPPTSRINHSIQQ